MPVSHKTETDTRYPAEQLPIGINWYRENIENVGRYIHDVLTEGQIPKNLSKGWVISPELEVLQKVQTEIFMLRPGEAMWPWGANYRAQEQMKEWEKELGGPVVYILAPETAQKDTPWLAQPVLRSWLTEGTPKRLVALYQKETEGTPMQLRYRAAVIACTGQAPS